MRITYSKPVSVTLTYDGAFKVHCYEDGSLRLSELLETIKEDIDQYGFEECEVVDSKTGELMMIVANG